MEIHDALYLSLVGIRRGADQSEIETDKNKRQRQSPENLPPLVSFLSYACHVKGIYSIKLGASHIVKDTKITAAISFVPGLELRVSGFNSELKTQDSELFLASLRGFEPRSPL